MNITQDCKLHGNRQLHTEHPEEQCDVRFIKKLEKNATSRGFKYFRKRLPDIGPDGPKLIAKTK
jgi:hypothetical protein